MKILLNKTGKDFNITWDIYHEIIMECGWSEFEVYDLLEGDLQLRSDPDFIRVIEKAGSTAFPQYEKEHERYEIVEVDIPEDKLNDYFIESINNVERVCKYVETTTIREIRGDQPKRAFEYR